MANLNQSLPALNAQIYGTVINLQTSVVLQTNLKARYATTQFLNYPFESIVIFNHQVIMASELGLFKQGGDKDEDEVITSYFEPIVTDFGIPNAKRLKFLYVSYKASKDLELTISTEQGVSRVYILKAQIVGRQWYRVPISRALYGVYWTLSIGSTGADYSFYEIKALPVILSHGLNRNQ